MGLVFEGRFAANDVVLDYDLRDLAIVAGPQGSWLYAVNGQNGGLSVFALDTTGTPQLIDSLYHWVSGLGVGRFDVGPDNQLILGGTFGAQLVQYQIEPDGSLSSRPGTALSGISAAGVGVLTSVELDQGHSAVYASGAASGSDTALMGWRLDSDGRVLGRVATAGAEAGYDLSGTVVLATGAGSATSSQVLLVADDSGLGLRSFRINGQSGALSLLDTFGPDQGLGLTTPTALQVFAAFGTRWVIVGAAGSSSLSVLQLGEEGSLSLSDHLIDNLQTRFGGLTALEVVQVDGHVFVLAAGSDDGLSLFRLVPGGQLVHMQSLSHDTGLGLQNVTALEAAVLGDQLQIFVSSQATAGITQFSIALEDLGTVVAAKGSSGAVLSGTHGDDLLMGHNSPITLRGRAGDDLLLAGQGGGVLTGGTGADIFMLCPTGDPLQISDFRIGQDQIDMSLFTELRSPGQLQVQTLTNGIRLRWQDTEITIYSADGTALTLGDLWPSGFIAPDRIPLGETLSAGIDFGSSEADLMTGSGGKNRIRGLDGEDTLRGGGGADRLWGGEDGDSLYGGAGRDQLWGQAGADLLKGGGGHDRLYGGAEQDILRGGRGWDSLTGGGGADQLSGKAGRDFLVGGHGSDILSGGAGRDVFVFGRKHGQDHITDFCPGTDHIDLSTLRGGIDSFDDLVVRQRGDNTLIITGEGKIWIEDLHRSDLDADDFIF